MKHPSQQPSTHTLITLALTLALIGCSSLTREALPAGSLEPPTSSTPVGLPLEPPQSTGIEVSPPGTPNTFTASFDAPSVTLERGRVESEWNNVLRFRSNTTQAQLEPDWFSITGENANQFDVEFSKGLPGVYWVRINATDSSVLGVQQVRLRAERGLEVQEARLEVNVVQASLSVFEANPNVTPNPIVSDTYFLGLYSTR